MQRQSWTRGLRRHFEVRQGSQGNLGLSPHDNQQQDGVNSRHREFASNQETLPNKDRNGFQLCGQRNDGMDQRLDQKELDKLPEETGFE